MRIYLGCDHAGFELKEHLRKQLTDLGHQVVDCGPPVYDPADDYPPYCLITARRVATDPGSLGIVIGGSGNGEQIAANKIPGIRAALVWSAEIARLARTHNNANVMGIGARMHTLEEAMNMVEIFLNTSFSEKDRHIRRIEQIRQFEVNGEIP